MLLLRWYVILSVSIGVAGIAAQAVALPRAVAPKGALPAMQTSAPTGRVVFKFHEDSGLRISAHGLVAGAQARTAAERIAALLTALAPGAVPEKHFRRPAAELDASRRTAEARSGQSLPDLNTYGRLETGTTDHEVLLRLVKGLAGDPAIETAFLEPVAVPAALGFSAFADADAAHAPQRVDNRDTPDFEPLQGYLDAAPLGVGAWLMRDQPGARGAGVQIVDVEGGWLWAHEDLPDIPFVEIGGNNPAPGWRFHGTAVMGEMRGTDNGYGVSGIVPDCTVGSSSIVEQTTAEAIQSADDALAPGGFILIELHAPGPNAGPHGSAGYVPMEYWQDIFDVIQHATAAGKIVCEAAGNGVEDLDDPVYQGLFDRNVRDSGAIMCGATEGSSLEPASFTNYGSRVDLHGWGRNVVTCGYGNLQGDPLPEEQYYTDTFSGTSSASPIVTGAAASLQGMVRAAFGMDLDARLARDILVATGTPQSGTDHIGPRPDLVGAWALAATGIGEVSGTVSDQQSGQPVADATVFVDQTTAFDITGAAGGYRFSLLSGVYDLSFSSFFYGSDTRSTSITSGATTVLDVALVPLPTTDLTGRVFADDLPQVDVRVLALDVPLPETTTGPDGWFIIAGAPDNQDYGLQFEGVAGYGAAYRLYEVVAPPRGRTDFNVALPPIDEDFESGAGGFYSDSEHWQLDTPSPDGPGAAFSGDLCWGVGNDGDYDDNLTTRLYSPTYDLTGLSATRYHLSFHYWAQTEQFFDGVNVHAWQDGQYELLHPVQGYSDVCLAGLGLVPGWSGHTDAWRGAVFDVSFAIGGTLQFFVEFGADQGANDHGFWIDGIAFDAGEAPTPVHDPELPAAATGVSVFAWPNPCNPRTTVSWTMATPGALDLEIFDLLGRRVRTLLDETAAAAQGSVTWDGRSTTDEPAPSGVYVLRLRAGNGAVATRRVILSR